MKRSCSGGTFLTANAAPEFIVVDDGQSYSASSSLTAEGISFPSGTEGIMGWRAAARASYCMHVVSAGGDPDDPSVHESNGAETLYLSADATPFPTAVHGRPTARTRPRAVSTAKRELQQTVNDMAR